jgi:hypothetical protein
VFIIRLLDGEEVHAVDGDKLTINQETGVLSVSRIDGFEEVTTHYSPSAWASVTHRIKEAVCGRRWWATRSNKPFTFWQQEVISRSLSQRFPSTFPAPMCDRSYT